MSDPTNTTPGIVGADPGADSPSTGEAALCAACPPESATRQIEPCMGRMVDAMAETLDVMTNTGSSDQARGYANAAMGNAKLAAGIAVGSAELTLTGIAQKALGEVQIFVGGTKLSEDDLASFEDPSSRETPDDEA